MINLYECGSGDSAVHSLALGKVVPHSESAMDETMCFRVLDTKEGAAIGQVW
jgi:hypothetical protein